MNWENFCIKINNILPKFGEEYELKYDSDKITYKIGENTYSYNKDEYDNCINYHKECNINRYSIYKEGIFEQVVDIPPIAKNNIRIFNNRLDNLNCLDSDRKMEYSIREISDNLLINIINYTDKSDIGLIFKRVPTSLFGRMITEESYDNLLSILKYFIRSSKSVLIKTNDKTDIDVIKEHMQSFLFNIAYNMEIPLKPLLENDILTSRYRTRRFRNSNNLEDIMPPMLSYKPELIDRYYMALSTQDPFVEYISYYHVMEHFFEEVYDEDIFKNIKEVIKHPGFSINRDKDIAKITDIVEKRIRNNKEVFQGSELEALELTIKKFADLRKIKEQLNKYDNGLIEYYLKNEVTFSNGDKIDLNNLDNLKLNKKIAARIYKTRNSLVHSKSNETRLKDRGIYKSFNDNPELSKEIPLMRFIAEEIIINSATPI